MIIKTLFQKIKAKKIFIFYIGILYFTYTLIIYSSGRFDWGYWLYKQFAPNNYVVFDNITHRLLAVSKEGVEQELLKLPRVLHISNAIQINDKSIFVVNTDDGAELYVYNAKSNRIDRRIVLNQLYYKTWEKIYLINNNLYIKVFYPRKLAKENLLPGAGESTFAYFAIPLRDILTDTSVNKYEPVHMEKALDSDEGLTLNFEQGIYKENCLEKPVHARAYPTRSAFDIARKNRFTMNLPIDIYDHNNFKIQYKNTEVLSGDVSYKAMGEYIINDHIFKSAEDDIHEFLRIDGIFNNKYILFSRWEEKWNLKAADYYGSVSPVLYVTDNKFFKKVYLPKFLWQDRSIIYIK